MNPMRGTVHQWKSRLRYVFWPINKVYILLLVPLQCWDSHSSCQHRHIPTYSWDSHNGGPFGETDHILPHPGNHWAATKRSTLVMGTC